eukprot:3492637-Amphidinium_carterae.1
MPSDAKRCSIPQMLNAAAIGVPKAVASTVPRARTFTPLSTRLLRARLNAARDHGKDRRRVGRMAEVNLIPLV